MWKLIVISFILFAFNSSNLNAQSNVRDAVDSLITAYDHTIDKHERSLMLKSVLYQIQDDRVANLLRSHLSYSVTEDNYYSAMYLSKKGDSTALRILNTHFWNWPVSSGQMSYTAKLFGEKKYYPATDNLIEALHAASMNLSGEALAALEALYPGSPKFASPSEAQKHFRQISSGHKNKRKYAKPHCR